MTVLTKPSLIVKKADVTEAPLVHENLCDEEKIDIHPAGATWSGKRSSGGLMCLSLTALLMASVGIICGLLLYRQYLHTTTHRYQAFCSIPIDARQEAQLRWRTDPDVQVFSTFIDNNDAEDMLVERLDIGDTFEKVLVMDSGRNFEFIHDFNVNLTAIVDAGRCFMMSLEPSLVLPPARLRAGIEAREPFPLSRVRTAYNVDLAAPADVMAAALMFMEACMDKPTYTLKVDDIALIRKRSTDSPPLTYVQFSGRHVQEIEIGNMDDVLAFEEVAKRSAAPSAAPAALPLEAQTP